MSQEPQESIELSEILRTHGWKPVVENPPPAEEKPTEENPSPPEQTFEIPEDLISKLSPPEKERVRNMPGGLFGDKEGEGSKDPWSRYDDRLGKVTVNAEDLETYTKALLFDSRFELPIRLMLGEEPLEVVCRSLYVSERETMALAVAKIAANYPIPTLPTAMVVADYYLKLALTVQLVSVNGQPMTAYDARPDVGQLPEESPKIEEMVKLARLAFQNTHEAKLKTLIRALHIFEVKQQILEDAYHNRDFPSPVGAN